jgi:pimeloyl-ACP methyl ester carboxylesterase
MESNRFAVELGRNQIVYREIGNGPPLVVLNGFAATAADWDPLFIDALAASHHLILLNNRGIGGSTDDGRSFDIGNLAEDTANVIATLGLERASVMGWSMGGFIAQALGLRYPDRIDKLILLSTDAGGSSADLTSSALWSQLIDTSGTADEQARRLVSLLFPSGIAEAFYRDFGQTIAAARAQLSPDLLKRQAVAMDSWHDGGVANCLQEIRRPVLVATGTDDVLIPPSNALKLVSAIPDAWLAQFPRSGHAFIAQYPRVLAELIHVFLSVAA